jgi:glutamate formiminotransferase/formiminotetrahydrofolate cyclodeaminase
MAKIVECVPNFSEGRDKAKIKEITDVIEAVPGVTLKDVDPGADMNRVVVTFVGSPEAAAEAAFRAVKKAAEVIDMRTHHGTHPRFGATDVCPFVPVNEVTMEDCVALAHQVGRRIGEELAIPVYLYEFAATRPERKNLAVVRRGEYEGLQKKLADPEWAPDYGPAEFNSGAGATAVGAREFLIAYNIDLNSRCKDHATDIAFILREKGRSVRTGNTRPFYYMGKLLKHEEGKFLCGSCDFAAPRPSALFEHIQKAHGYDGRELYRLNDMDPDALAGQSVKQPGLYPYCKAIGWEVPQYGRVQISINLTNYKVTPTHLVLDKARELAAERGLAVTGSEIVGLVPLPAMLETGKHYLKAQRRSAGVPVDDLLETAVQSLGLRDVAPFDLRDKVIGYPEPAKGALIAKRTDEFVHEVSRESPAPGGGSVAALSGALGAALASMVANLTVGKSGYEAAFEEMGAVAEEAQILKDQLLRGVDEDTQAFNAYMEAMRLPKNTKEEQAKRKAAMQAGLKQAVDVPLETAKRSLRAIALAKRAAEIGNRNSVSDAGVGAQMAFGGVVGGCLNVLINLPGIEDQAFVDAVRAEVAKIQDEARALLEETQAAVLGKIGKK